MRSRARQNNRKIELINAAIETIARSGTLDVTVADIAREAGMSPALAHHYFGSKDQIFLSTMREILRRYGVAVRAELGGLDDPRARLLAVLDVSLGPEHFDSGTVAAWLNFYVLAQRDRDAARLLRVYHRRLRSTLLADLRKLAGDRAAGIAETLGALIDGVYLRHALDRDPPQDLLSLPRAYLLSTL
ncbi:MAG TPA: transcriptional regulator BetI [Paracoccus sp. (in: a-proteobacteria)]|uniref:transcriptional regulator BetI n=1 Tax=uncultured Paracoccus sp. TaxID=189685 RepID=UPI00262365E0|nr:transcriptional regulator BetI [uncultured Paracoccus sp.]HMQ41362.1 transcriptional regulator BetI [Paracoccus sp. (in: a-proteobacteria)]HMR35951.1 transcriptional regulator BetI [Paracoccus sp. (in: a-proteobacteria)]